MSTNARWRSRRTARSAAGSHDASVTDNPDVQDSQPRFVHFDDVKAFELAPGVTGRPLFGAGEETPTPVLMEKIQHDEPQRLRKYNPASPRDLEAIVHRLTARRRIAGEPS